MKLNSMTFAVVIILAVLVSSLFGSLAGFWSGTVVTSGSADISKLFSPETFSPVTARRTITTDAESAVIAAVEKVSPAVVSIIVTKNLPVIERYYIMPDDDGFLGASEYRREETVEREIGGGSGFLIAPDGYIITNNHVVADTAASYTVLLNDGSKHEATVLANDPATDLAVIKIEVGNLPVVTLGESADLKVGQSVIAIGNSLGEFRNTVSNGIISGLSRQVTAGGTGGAEELFGVIQTDASINPGNSGGPLVDLSGEVIGINTAMALGAENIGFAIPVDAIKDVYESVRRIGRVIRPWLGVRYITLDEAIAAENGLDRSEGAWIVEDAPGEPSVVPGSPADKAGLEPGDLIIELDGERINRENPLSFILRKRKPGDAVTMKITRGKEEIEVTTKLEEMK
ncbi:MAG: trypsin-like peptidase domain-containing protein [Candidatus Falkowbacteria bacterium]